MQSLEEVYNRLKIKKAERKDLKESFRDELRNHARHEELTEQINKLKLEKKAIENEILSREMDRAKLEEVSLDIKTDIELLTDIVLNKFLASEPVEVVDEIQVRWVPKFRVTFEKA
ncbi:MAG: hypothetical protein WC802_04375 [Patescibacteria group bacterium]|jgi:hypothetical protein